MLFESKTQKKPKLVTRKIKFKKYEWVNEGWLIVTATKVAKKYQGYILRYKIRSYWYTSSITFKCPEDNWLRLHCEFVGETNSMLSNVRCRNRL